VAEAVLAPATVPVPVPVPVLQSALAQPRQVALVELPPL